MNFHDVKIFVPTKNRWDKQKTYEILKSIGLNPILVIEPQEEVFAKKYNYILLPENDRGIAYSRNYILDYSRKNEYDYIAMVDDDIYSFYKKNEEGKLLKNDNVFIEVLNIFIENKFSLCGMEFRHIAWCQNEKITFNHSIHACMMFYLPSIPLDIRFDSKSKEDKDLAIQLIKAGCKTVKLNDYAFSTPVMGTNAGGLHDWYTSQEDRKASEYMLEKWGRNIITLKDKGGRIDAMVNWKNIKNDEFALF